MNLVITQVVPAAAKDDGFDFNLNQYFVEMADREAGKRHLIPVRNPVIRWAKIKPGEISKKGKPGDWFVEVNMECVAMDEA